jgi:cell division protein FtsB
MLLRVLVAAVLVALIGLQYRLWVGEGSLAEVRTLQQEIALQKEELAGLKARNRALQAEVRDLKDGLEAIEERARAELGMIKEGETFYQIIGEAK